MILLAVRWYLRCGLSYRDLEELLAERGYDSSMGARPLRRTIQREIEDPLSEKMLFGEIPRGSNVLVDVAPGEDGLEFTFASTPKADVPDMPPVETAGTD